MEKVRNIKERVKGSVIKNFRYATVNFIFIMIFISAFQAVFGAENSIVGIIFTTMMPSSMARDLTARPVKHLGIQTAVLFLMTVSACFVANAPVFWALPVNFIMIFVILYAYTFEYRSQLYFPYILSYLFLVFISPVPPQELPKRLLGVFAGAVCIILYQLVNGRKRVAETSRDVLISMIDQAEECVKCLLSAKGMPQDPEQLRATLCKLCQIIYDRRKRALCISDASFAVIDAGRELESLVIRLYEMEGAITPERAGFLEQVLACLERFRAYAAGQAKEPPDIGRDDFSQWDLPEAEPFRRCLLEIRRHMLDMARPEKRKHYRKTLLSVSVRLKAALRVSPVRAVYALRVACLLALGTLFVQLLGLTHGRWLLFTIASVSLPYADDVGAKAKQRLAATMIGGACAVVIFSLIPNSAGRTALMMLSGYLSFYFSGYCGMFTCSTVGALGGAVFMTAFGWGPIGSVLLIRLGYIVLGILIALAGNLLFFPFRRRKATRQLVTKYRKATRLLTAVCREREPDPQLYYGLVIQIHLLEDKIIQNAKDLNWDGVRDLLEESWTAVRAAHRNRMELVC